jgi:uncharacterized membrane protein YgcG
LATRQVLGQQIAAAINPQAMMAQAVAAQQQAAAAAAAGNPAGVAPAGNNPANTNPLGNTEVAFALPMFQGAVGYQPVIIVLPEGAQMGIAAVVSTDRRYVRVACDPYFDGVASVSTFNMLTGSSATQSSGQGQGFSGYSGTSGQTGASSASGGIQ